MPLVFAARETVWPGNWRSHLEYLLGFDLLGPICRPHHSGSAGTTGHSRARIGVTWRACPWGHQRESTACHSPPTGAELTCPHSPLIQTRHQCHSPASEELFLIFPGVREPPVPMPPVARTMYYDGHFNSFSLSNASQCFLGYPENMMHLGFPPA